MADVSLEMLVRRLRTSGAPLTDAKASAIAFCSLGVIERVDGLTVVVDAERLAAIGDFDVKHLHLTDLTSWPPVRANIQFRRVKVAAREEGRGVLVLADGWLIAALVQLSSHHGKQSGHWFLENGYGRFSELGQTTFPTLSLAKDWFANSCGRPIRHRPMAAITDLILPFRRRLRLVQPFRSACLFDRITQSVMQPPRQAPRLANGRNSGPGIVINACGHDSTMLQNRPTAIAACNPNTAPMTATNVTKA